MRSSNATEKTMVAKTMLKMICWTFMLKIFWPMASSREDFAV
jgi:hypothetical protein